MTTPEPREFSPEDPVVPAAHWGTAGAAGPAMPTVTGLSGSELPGSPMPPMLPAVPERKSRKPLLFGLGGLGVGLIVGLLLGAVGSAVGSTLTQSSAIPQAVEACSATDIEGVDVMDKGKSLKLQTEGEESFGTTVVTVVCVLDELDAPESLFTKLESTRALDGTQSADWSGFTASWTYHPDSGLNIIVETAGK